MHILSPEDFMREAIKEAEKAAKLDEIPIGAIIEKDGKIIARGHNMTESKKDPTAHAEIIAIRKASKKLGGWRLLGCNMYVTTEPCSMCAGAMVLARIKTVYIGTADPKTGACGSVVDIVRQEKLNHQIEVKTGILQQECEVILKTFFKKLRKKKSEENTK